LIENTGIIRVCRFARLGTGSGGMMQFAPESFVLQKIIRNNGLLHMMGKMRHLVQYASLNPCPESVQNAASVFVVMEIPREINGST
jgi:hypothetical protein